MEFLFFTRFSVFIKPVPTHLSLRHLAAERGISTKDTSGMEAMYRDFLYSKHRMDFKLQTFSKLTIPSVLKSLEPFPRARWVIYTSSEMPSEYRDALHSMVGEYPQVCVVELQNGLKEETADWLERVRLMKAASDRYCTIRIDDDDSVADDLTLSILRASMKHQTGPFIFHSSKGRYCKFDDAGDIVVGSPVTEYHGLLTQGLAGIDLDIRGLGNHALILERYPDIPVIENEDSEFLMCADLEFTASKKKFQ